MLKEKIKKLARYRVNAFIAAVVLLSVTLFSTHAVLTKGMGFLVFAGRVSAQIPMATCSNIYTCSACSLCGCGSWDQDIIAPIYGRTLNSTFYACKMPSFVPMGTGQFMVGSIVFGYCYTNVLSTFDGIGCNIWSVWQ
jgi:hypothetical protein